MMDRLDFTLPDFTRLSWVGDDARAVWEPRISRITRAWIEMEWLSVARGVRPCCLTVVTPEDFVARGGEWAKMGLCNLPVEIQGIGTQPYASTGVPTEPGKPFAFRFVLGAPADVVQFQHAWETGDQEAIGQLLGYPPCCYRFFHDVWVDQGLVDTTWPMGAATADAEDGATTVEVQGPPEANILWRWMGVRAVSHLPCRFDCPATVELGQRMIAVGREAGYGAEMDWLLEVLSWPAEWSALHGIAEIKTPILRVATRTDATARKYVVQRTGERYPVEGAHGLQFPYRVPRAPRLTGARAFQRGIENPIPLISVQPPWYATDNGFSSQLAMDRAHEPIVALASATLDGRGGDVLDLGCGNGALLGKIQEANPGVTAYGIELEGGPIEHAHRHSGSSAQLVQGDMFESEEIWPEGRRYALALIMPGRLLEAGLERAAKLQRRLAECCDRVLVYGYGDWLTRYGNLHGLARAAGFEPQGLATDALASLAMVEPVGAGDARASRSRSVNGKAARAAVIG